MTRYTLRRETIAGATTVRTTNPHRVTEWLFDALDQRSTVLVTITRETVQPVADRQPQCEGQRSAFDELDGATA